MAKQEKYNKILDALKELLETKELSTISVSEIAQTAGIGKGSIYYYFSSKDAILEALVARSYKEPLNTAKQLAEQTDISPFTRMAMISGMQKFFCCFFKNGDWQRNCCTGKGISAPEISEVPDHRIKTGSHRNHKTGHPDRSDHL